MKKVAICINMLSPYWKPVFNELGKFYQIIIFVGTSLEPNRQYDKNNINTEGYNFKIIKNKNLMIDLRKFHFKTELLYIQIGLWRDLLAFKPDIIISNELGIRTAISLIYGKLFNIPVIPWICVSKHTERNISILRRLWRKILLYNIKLVFTNLSLATQYLMDEFKFKKEKIINVPYTLNVDEYYNKVKLFENEAKLFKEKHKLKGKVFLYIGQMIERKGLFMIEKYFNNKKINKSLFTLLFIGGNLPINVRDKLLELKINFLNIDFVQPNELPKYYAAADVFFFPSLEDEWGIVINEAASAGLPLLSSVYAAVTYDLVVDGKNGYSFDPFNSIDTTEKFLKLVKLNKDQLKQMGAESRSLAKKYDINYTLNNFISGIEIILQK